LAYDARPAGTEAGLLPVPGAAVPARGLADPSISGKLVFHRDGRVVFYSEHWENPPEDPTAYFIPVRTPVAHPMQ
jgi:hypothetical protein